MTRYCPIPHCGGALMPSEEACSNGHSGVRLQAALQQAPDQWQHPAPSSNPRREFHHTPEVVERLRESARRNPHRRFCLPPSRGWLI